MAEFPPPLPLDPMPGAPLEPLVTFAYAFSILALVFALFAAVQFCRGLPPKPRYRRARASEGARTLPEIARTPNFEVVRGTPWE